MNRNKIFERVYSESILDGYISLNEASRRSLNRIFNNLEKFSYIIISSDRGELSEKDNLKRFKKLKSIVNEMGYSFIPVKGGFIEEKDSTKVYENSLIIFPISKSKPREKWGLHDDEELFNFGLDLIQYDPVQQNENGEFIGDDPSDVESFGQDSFLFKGNESIAAYYGKDGEKQFEVGNDYIVNDKFAQYFTQLVKDQGKDDRGKFTFTEAYMTKEPMSIASRHVRYLEGELMNFY